jgi:hypothetical protein
MGHGNVHPFSDVKVCFGKLMEVILNHLLVGAFKHGLYFPFHIWDVIPTPLTNSYFQRGRYTTNQWGLQFNPRTGNPEK